MLYIHHLLRHTPQRRKRCIHQRKPQPQGSLPHHILHMSRPTPQPLTIARLLARKLRLQSILVPRRKRRRKAMPAAITSLLRRPLPQQRRTTQNLIPLQANILIPRLHLATHTHNTIFFRIIPRFTRNIIPFQPNILISRITPNLIPFRLNILIPRLPSYTLTHK